MAMEKSDLENLKSTVDVIRDTMKPGVNKPTPEELKAVIRNMAGKYIKEKLVSNLVLTEMHEGAKYIFESLRDEVIDMIIDDNVDRALFQLEAADIDNENGTHTLFVYCYKVSERRTDGTIHYLR